MVSMNEKTTTGAPVSMPRCTKRIGTPLLILSIVGIAVACLLLSAPASAGTKYMAGSPELSAYISGTNEFLPGDSVSLPVTIQNTGYNEYKFVDSSIVDRDDLPDTAKFLIISLAPGDSPIIVKSDPQMVGDLTGSTTTTCSFTIKIPSDARAGTYSVPVGMNYSYLYYAEQYGTDAIQYYYKNVNKTVTIPITIKNRVQIDVVSTDIGEVNAGTEGTLKISVKNTGDEDGKKSILKIAQSGTSPVTPTDSSVYLGDFTMGETVTGTFRISAADDTEEQTYPLDVYVSYENSEGDTVTSETETIGIPVGRKAAFSITSDPVTITAGKKKVITVSYRNTGGATVYDAQARISAVDPFTCSDDVAYFGTVSPGESRDAAFEISVDGGATAKEYGLDSEIEYRDSLDNSRVSDPLKVTITVEDRQGAVESLTSNPLLLGILVAIIIIGIAGYAFWYRKRDQ